MAITNLLAGMGGLPSLSGLFGRRQDGYLTTLLAGDLAANTDVVSTGFRMLGTGYSVLPQQVVNLGFGIAGQPMNQAYLYMVFKDSSDAAMEGMVRIQVSDANGRRTDVVFQNRTEELGGDPNDKSKKIAFPEITSYRVLGRSPREHDIIAVAFKPDSSGTWGVTNSTIRLPCTTYA